MTENKWLSVFTNQYQSRADIWVAAVIRNIAKTTTSCQFSSRSNHQTDRRWEENKIENPSILHKVIKLPFDPRFNLPDRSPHQGLTISACVWFLIDPLRLSPSPRAPDNRSLSPQNDGNTENKKEITRILTGEILDGWWISDDQDTRSENWDQEDFTT